ncbi:MAG TPA: hypothetical protein VMJ73_12150 [Rhizomicrobium sp.]|nr:hypothetical protein [Rhizomicrobium sp.]
MALEIHLDFETRSDHNIKTEGAERHFCTPHFRPLILCWRLHGTSDIQTWVWPQPCPDWLSQLIESGATILAYNANFERRCLNWLADNAGWPRVADDRYRCSAAEAAAMGLPRKLERVAAALGLPEQKDKAGDALIRFFSNPRKPRKDETGPGPFWHEPEDYPERFAEFSVYCAQDVRTEEALSNRLFRLSDYEQRVWNLDYEINSRGIRVDVASCRAALRLVEKAKARLDAEMATLTGGVVPACTNVAKLVAWCEAQGAPMPSISKGKIEEALGARDLPPQVRTALELRGEAAKTSTAKLNAFLKRMSDDGRLRGTYLYHAASTGRWSNVGANLANLPRPRKEYEDAVESGFLRPDTLFQAFRDEDPDKLTLLYGEKLGRPMHLVSDAIRGFLWAAPGCEFITADYSGIEGVVIAWLMREEWKLQAFREILADPTLPDMYRRTAASIMNTTTDVITKKHPYRQSVGKVSELQLGFGGGVSAFFSMASAYGVNLHELHAPVWEVADDETRNRAVRRYENCVKARDKVRTDVMSREAWLACEIIKIGWRRKHGKFVEGWAALEDAMRDAIRYPGQKFDACRITYMVAKNFLLARLPSGRCLAYGAPRLKDQVWAKIQNEDGSWPDQASTLGRAEAERLELAGRAKIESVTKPAVTALGVNSVTGKYERFAIIKTIASENVTQAVARDILVHGMFNVDSAGYPVVLHTYDEAVAEVKRGFGSIDDFVARLLDLPEWGKDIPLGAHGFRSKRYRK